MRSRAALGAPVIALAIAIAATLPVWADARSDGDLRTLRGDEALLVLPIRSSAEFDSLEFEDAASKRSFTVDDVPDRFTLTVLKVPAGSYFLRKVVLPKDYFVDYERHDRWVPKFEVKAGALNYVGELRLRHDDGRVWASLGGNAMDALPTLLRRERRLAPDLLARFPFVLGTPLDGTALLGHAPDPAWRFADWSVNAPVLDAEGQRALGSAVFDRFGATLPAVGTGFADARKSLEALSKRHAHFEAFEDDQELLVLLDGLWGERGQLLGFQLLFVDGKFAQVVVRGFEDDGSWCVPVRDARDDLEAFVAGR